MEITATSRPPAKGFTAWSFSRLKAYNMCPLRAKLQNIDRLPSPESAQMARGSNIHTQAEQYIRDGGAQVPESLAAFADLFRNLRKAHAENKVLVEDSWAFRADWSITTWDDWDHCRVRMKVDMALLEGSRLTILDWKTGKFNLQWNAMEYEQQVELYSLGALLMFGAAVPDLEVWPALVFLDHGVTWPDKPSKGWTMKDLPKLKRTWEDRTAPLLNDRQFAPKPGGYCRFCPYAKDAEPPSGGNCQYDRGAR